MTKLPYKTIILKFNEPLTQEQEDKLINSFQFLVERVKLALLKAQRVYKRIPAIVFGEHGKVMKQTIEFVLDNFGRIFILEKTNDTLYIFKMAGIMDSLTLPLGIKQLDYWEKFKSEYIKMLHQEVLPKLKIQKETVVIGYGEDMC